MPGGRPTKYKPEIPEQLVKAQELAGYGFTLPAIARFFNIGESTVSRWLDEIPEFREAIKKVREPTNAAVEQALYTRAIGYSHRETKVFREGGKTITVDIDKHYAPSETSMIFWLKNRDPTRWKDVKERIDTHKFEDTEMSDLELARRIVDVFENAMVPVKLDS